MPSIRKGNRRARNKAELAAIEAAEERHFWRAMGAAERILTSGGSIKTRFVIVPSDPGPLPPGVDEE